MIIYNLLFDFTEPNGLFSDMKGGKSAFGSSKVWLASPKRNLKKSVRQLVAMKWTNLGQAGTVLFSYKKNRDDICIRVAPVSGKPAPGPKTILQLVVSFGRPVQINQQHASPFTHNGKASGCVRTTYLLDPKGPGIPRNFGDGWLLNMGKIVKNPVKAMLVHRYEFSLGVIVTDGEEVRYYGEDPEMDVDG